MNRHKYGDNNQLLISLFNYTFVEDFVTGKVIQPLDLSERTYPDLHMMGELFLPCFMRQLFDLCTVLLL